MTAEIGIISRTGVALATDSAVSISLGDNNIQKIFNSADKLFSLSKYQPVGIMVYGSATLMGIPWETLIKVYRAELGRKLYPKLEDYCTSFLKFIKAQSFRFTKKDQTALIKEKTAWFYQEYIVDKITETVKEVIETKGEIGTRRTRSIAKATVNIHYNKCKKLEFVEDFNDQFIESYILNNRVEIQQIIGSVFKETVKDKPTFEKLIYISACLFCKEDFVQERTGIVIAGFGEKEILPEIRTYYIECLIENKLVFALNQGKSEKCESNTVAVIPFAQDEVVKTFIEGIEPSLFRVMQESFEEILEEFPKLIAQHIEPALKTKQKEIAKLRDMLLDAYYESIADTIRNEHIFPVLRTVGVLPKEELAAMAETLVNLTSFKRRVTTDSETVGGPVDVAVITKGDGFIWMKRKHYFKPELNHHFFANYYDE